MGTGGVSNARDYAGPQHELARSAKRLLARRAVPNKGAVLKAGAALIALLLLSTIPGGSDEYSPLARTTAAPGVFSSPVMVNDNRANDQAVPVVIATPNYGLLVSWQDARSGNEDIYVSRSLDNGTSFTPNRRADDSIGSSKQIEPAVVVSANGTILLTWQDNRRVTFDYDIFFAKSYDGGNSFTRNIKVDDSFNPITWQERPSIAVTSSGTIYIAWTDDRTGTLRSRGAYSTDGGATFSSSGEIASVAGTSGQTGVVVTSNGNRIFAAFMDNASGTPHPYVCISSNGGKTFSSPTRLDDTGRSAVPQRDIAIAPVPGGGIVAVWEDFRNGSWDIHMSVVSSHGAITTPDFRVDDDMTGADQLSPSVASDQLGNIFVAWADERDSLYAVRFSFLAAGEPKFNASIEVARPSINDMQRRPSVISTEPGRVFVAWQDDRLGSYDVYFSGAFFPELFGLSLASGWNMISIPSVGYAYKASTLGLKSGDVVTGWNSTTQAYTQTYIVGVSPPSFDFALAPSTGYWVYTGAHERINLKGNIPTTKQSKHIVVPTGGGWVPVGFESLNTTRFASDILKMLNITGGITSVVSYDTVTGTYQVYNAGAPPFMDFLLVPGRGLWCWSSVSGELTYFP